MDTIFKNYIAFYNMVLSTTMMSNTQTPELKADANRIIDFIGRALRLNEAFIDHSKRIILDDLSSLGLTADQQAVYRSRTFGDNYSDKDILFDIKGDVLTRLQNLSDMHNAEINPSWFDYSHYKTYQSNIRFSKIYTASASGNLLTTRQVGILLALGIGCDTDINEAIHRFTQCVFWGDIPSMFYLAYTYILAGDKQKSKVFYELADLSEKYLKSGYTILPDAVKNLYSKEAQTYYVYISSIKQDVVYAYDKTAIDFSFVEAITSDSLDYFEKMEYINNYEKKEWKNVTNSSEKPPKKLGFK